MVKTGKDVDLNVVRVLEVCRDIELHIAELYRFFSEIFSDNSGIADLWKKTEAEEISHANQFVLAINLRKEQVIEKVNVDLYAVNNALQMVQSIYNSVRKTRPTITDALRSAIKLEEKLAHLHMDTVSHFNDASCKALFTAMMNADRDHVGALQEAYRKILNNDS